MCREQVNGGSVEGARNARAVKPEQRAGQEREGDGVVPADRVVAFRLPVDVPGSKWVWVDLGWDSGEAIANAFVRIAFAVL